MTLNFISSTFPSNFYLGNWKEKKKFPFQTFRIDQSTDSTLMLFHQVNLILCPPNYIFYNDQVL